MDLRFNFHVFYRIDHGILVSFYVKSFLTLLKHLVSLFHSEELSGRLRKGETNESSSLERFLLYEVVCRR